jgi:outer membrane usher protein
VFSAVSSAQAELAPIDTRQAPVLLVQSLRLEVFINGVPTHLVEPFTLSTDQHLLAKPTDLEDIGIKVPGYQDPLQPLDIATLPNVTYRFDAPAQKIDFQLSDKERLAHVYDAHSTGSRLLTPRADWGALVNYSLFGTSTNRLSTFPRFSGLNATIEARAFSPYGEISQTGIVGNTILSQETALRLDSTYTYSDPDRMLTGRAGDTISGSLVWTRPIRYGGLQLQRDFTLRSDLVTQPLPNLSGSAAVPSTVDVFINSVKTYSQDVAAGPYSITNLPVVGGNGTAHVIVTDATGRSTDTAVPFFTAPTLLAKGLTDFSLDAGFARRNYGLLTADYDRQPLGSVIGRYGATEWLTLEGHAEGGAGLVNLGGGSVVRAGQWGTISAAIGGSHVGSRSGAQFNAGYDIEFFGITVDLNTQRTLASFNDLASVTSTTLAPSLAASFAAGSYSLDPRPPRALDRITVGLPLKFDLASISASFIDLVEANGTRSRIATVSLSRQLPYDASLFVTGFVDLSQSRNMGVFAGISIPLGPRIHANIGGSTGDSGRYAQIDVGQTLQPANGSFGWRVRDLEGTNAIRVGDASYRSTYGTAQIEVSQQRNNIDTQGALDGSIGYIDNGGLFFGNHVADGFALVNTGISGVPVYRDNRLIGETDPWGKLVVPDLRSFQGNQIGIDPLALPMNAEARSTKQLVAPAARSGVGIDFGIDRRVDAAMVRLQDAAGHPIPAGTKGHRKDDSDSFVIGYDGQAYIKHLQRDNVIIVDLGDHDCTASFSYQAAGGKRVAIGPIPCL